ncbi:MAG: alpha/beta fold hydrolase [Oceanicaulis sp.]
MARASTLPSWEDESAWRAIYDALPDGLAPPKPYAVQEEWRRIAGFDVHVDRWIAPSARARIILLHGGGGHGRLLGPFAWSLALHGFECLCPDLPGYGLTRAPKKSKLVYDHWREVAAGLIEAERQRGGALFVFGLSMGGMLAYDACAMTGAADGLIATCFLDPTRKAVRRAVVRQPWMAGLIDPLFKATPRALDGLMIPMALAGNMKAIANDPALTRAVLADKRAGGNAMPTGFLRTWMTSPPVLAPESFDACPVLMIHPEDDRWTGVDISDGFFDLLPVLKRRVLLRGAGHFPVEQPGASQLDKAISELCAALTERRPLPEQLV